jgi:hypothetical protein
MYFELANEKLYTSDCQIYILHVPLLPGIPRSYGNLQYNEKLRECAPYFPLNTKGLSIVLHSRCLWSERKSGEVGSDVIMLVSC